MTDAAPESHRSRTERDEPLRIRPQPWGSLGRSSRLNLIGPVAGPRGGGIGMVMSGAFDALREVADVHLVQHRSADPPSLRRLRYLAEWARAMTAHPAFNLYLHVDLARLEALFPPGLRPPYGIFIHGIELWRPISRAARAALEEASLLLTNSHTTLRIAREHHPWLPDATVVHLGLSRDPPAPGPWPRPARVLFFARLETTEREKGQDLMLDAWPAISAAHPDAELVFAGAGSDLPRLRARVATEGLRNVRFEGFVSEERKWELLRTSRMLAFPSTQEGFGLVAIEAAAVGTPVVAIENTAIAEVFEAGAGALLIRRDQPGADSMIAACHTLLSDAEHAHTLGRAGFSLTRRLHSRASFEARLRTALNVGAAANSDGGVM